MSIEDSVQEAAQLRGRRDFNGSERVLRAALADAPASPRLLTDLAATVSQLGRHAEMEQHLRAALAADAAFVPAAEPLAQFLLGRRRFDEVLALAEPFAGRADAASVIRSQAAALRGLQRIEESLPLLAALAEQRPDDGLLQHELTASLVDAGRFAEAEARLDKALAADDHGADWLIRGYLMRQQGRLDEAEAAYRKAVERAPDQTDALRELSDLIWIRTADAAAAVAPIDQAIAGEPGRAVLRQLKARILLFAGDNQGAYATLEPLLGKAGVNLALDATASQAAVAFDPVLSLRLAQRAMQGFPDNANIMAVCAEASLAADRPAQAQDMAGRIRRLAPTNQHGVALLATAWRAMGDDRYRALNDYERLVRTERLDTPDGWDSLDGYLKDLTAALRDLKAAPILPAGHAYRNGGQPRESLDRSDHPAIKGLAQAIDGPVRRYLAELGQGKDPLRSRNTGAYGLSGSWLVKQRPGGRRVGHLDAGGWLSAIGFLDEAQAMDGEERAGWLSFGEPGVPTVPPLAAEHWVRPEPGLLVLFPSYLWHGTEAFGGDQPRLTTAFDVVPA